MYTDPRTASIMKQVLQGQSALVHYALMCMVKHTVAWYALVQMLLRSWQGPE